MLTVKERSKITPPLFICSFPVCSYSDPAPILAYVGGVSKKHNSDGLTTQKHRRLCMIGWLQCSALFFHPQCVPQCPKMSHNVSHIVPKCPTSTCDDSFTLVHTLFNGVGFSSVYQQTKAKTKRQTKKIIFRADLENFKRRKLT